MAIRLSKLNGARPLITCTGIAARKSDSGDLCWKTKAAAFLLAAWALTP
jgi:hypothetical protein